MIPISKQKRAVLVSIVSGALLLAALMGLFRLSYLYDNKYTAGPPYGEAGIISFTAKDLERPLFLIDGWMLSVDGGPESETFIGEYSNFSYVEGHEGNPFGSAHYRLSLRCPGEHILVLELPEIFSDYTLSVNGVPVATRGSGTMVELLLRDEAELVLETENHTHYYSGLFYPPILGAPDQVDGVRMARTIFYAAVLFCALSLAAFSAALWVRRRDEPMYFHFGLLCICFALTYLHTFMWYAGAGGPLWYAVEDAARLGMLAQAIHLAAFQAGWVDKRSYIRYVRPVCLLICFLCFCTVVFIIPSAGDIINLYGRLIDGVSLCGWAVLCAAAAQSLRKKTDDALPLSAACFALGTAFLTNLLNGDRFEPIRFGWQTEYAGFALVLLFGVLLARYNRRVLTQNRALMTRMEELVQERTRELGTILEERKTFFSNMAHDLKAPIAAVHNYIALMRQGNLYLDDELRDYIHQVETGNEELRRRVEALSALNAFDRVTEPLSPQDIDGLMERVEREYTPDAAIMGIHLLVGRLGRAAAVRAQREKLMILFENLIFNAISFTPRSGSITVTPRLEDGRVVIEVADTGSGIAHEHLPHVFEQFYTARENKNEGSGLGLYICKLTVAELGGAIEVNSELGTGTTFRIRIPLSTEPAPE